MCIWALMCKSVNQPRSQALSYDTPRGGETLVGAGHVILQILSALGGVGKVSYYMLPLSGPSFPQPPCWTTSFFLSCLEFALLNSVYKEIILKPKQVLCLESVYVRLANGLREVLNFSPSANVVIIFAKYKLRSDVLLGWRSNASSTTVVNSIVIVVSPLNSLMKTKYLVY